MKKIQKCSIKKRTEGMKEVGKFTCGNTAKGHVAEELWDDDGQKEAGQDRWITETATPHWRPQLQADGTVFRIPCGYDLLA